MAEPPIVSEETDKGAGDEDAKSVHSGGSKPASKSPSRVGSAHSHESGNDSTATKDKGQNIIPSPVDSGKDNPAADWRNMRRIIAEDPEWSLATVPLMVELCVKHIVQNFESE